MSTKQSNSLSETRLAFIGAGVMAEAMIAGLLHEEIVIPEQIVASHPRAERREELTQRYKIRAFERNIDAVRETQSAESSMVVLCVKPQRVLRVMDELQTVINDGQLVISIVAGSSIETISKHLGTSKVVRAMPNTPAQIGHGMTAWTCTDEVCESERTQVAALLSALGKQLFVETEHMIDMATSLSATGPTYIFMLMEALTDAGVHLGFSREIAKELVQETMLGSTLFAMESHKHPAELRNMVTSPGGTSAAAIYEMEKGGLRTVLSKAVYAAYQRAVALGKRTQ
ncbi:MAG: pyrroline-5-carboxylate reductase [Pyrinomonadaceae bacterium]